NMTYDFKVGLTAIVGKNGAGKSTLVKLLSGLIKPNEGKISIVNTEGEEQDLDSHAKSVLFQEPTHFYLSIRHNITMQSEVEPNEDKKIIDVLQQTGLWNLVKQLPDGRYYCGSWLWRFYRFIWWSMATTCTCPNALP